MVSVIITTYKNEQYLPRAIESVLVQSYREVELIVVDDNDPDSSSRKATEEIMKRYPQVLYLKHPANRNGACARNTGIAKASGEYIAFLDNDDIYLEHHLERCVQVLDSHPDRICAFCTVLKIRQGLCWEIVPPLSGDGKKKLFLSETALGTGSNLFIRSEAVRTLQGFDESFLRHQDVEFGLRLLDLGKGISINRIGILKEMDGHSNVPDFRHFLRIKEQLWSKYEDMLKQLTPAELASVFANQYHSLLYTACMSGDPEAITLCVRRLRTCRNLNSAEILMVVLTRLHLFDAYEALKFAFKKRRSGTLLKQAFTEISQKDRRYFDSIS